jgi:transcriptional regulator with XRE-family HTH domain
MIPRGRLVRAARTLLGWTQEDLAHYAGVPRNAVSGLELDQKDTRLTTVEKVNAALERAGLKFVDETPEFERGLTLYKERAPSPHMHRWPPRPRRR